MSYPFSPLVALVLAGFVLALAGRASRWWRRAGLVLLVLGWLGCTALISNPLVAILESRAGERTENCEDLEAAVLLTGGLVRRPRHADDIEALNPETQLRLMTLARMDRPDVPLVITGGGFFTISEAELAWNFLRRVEPRRTQATLETRSDNTWENARFTAALLPPPRRIAVATSAVHLPRARLAFERMGYTVCPWPLNRSYVPGIEWWALLPHATAARRTESFLHEVGGWIVYAWREVPDEGG
jgi:uncharacterized SAM-binding protein YcdF (DUF218 family)